MSIVRCSDCFEDEGLKQVAFSLGNQHSGECSLCNSTKGRLLDKKALVGLAHQFFVKGSFHKTSYGGAPIIEFNEHQKTSIAVSDHLKSDLKIFEKDLGVGFFYYGPPTWMIGEVEPLKNLQDSSRRKSIISKIFETYKSVTLSDFDFYRIRVNPKNPADAAEYDTPPHSFKRIYTRLDSEALPVLYGSFDVSTCLHECRVSYEDNLYIATLIPTCGLRLLDLNEIINEEVTPFESLDMAISLLFGATSHSYEICQELAKEARVKGFDGIIYPSYYTELQSGVEKFGGTSFGLPHRWLPQFKSLLQRQTYPNVAIFGRPISEGKIQVKCINRIYLNRVEYDYGFGPVVK